MFIEVIFVSFSCVGVDEDEAPDIDVYHCPNCETLHGKSTCKFTERNQLSQKAIFQSINNKRLVCITLLLYCFRLSSAANFG